MDIGMGGHEFVQLLLLGRRERIGGLLTEQIKEAVVL
jgi:hypothetical protein